MKVIWSEIFVTEWWARVDRLDSILLGILALINEADTGSFEGSQPPTSPLYQLISLTNLNEGSAFLPNCCRSKYLRALRLHLKHDLITSSVPTRLHH